MHVIAIKTLTINSSMDEALLFFSSSCHRLVNNSKTTINTINNDDYINSSSTVFLQPLHEEVEVTDAKFLKISEHDKDTDNDDFLRRINILNRKRL